MKDWFMAGGFGMFPILAVGAFAIGVGARAAMAPTVKRISLLRALISLTVLCSLFAFGTNLWAVNVHLSDPAFLKSAGIAAGDLAFTGIIGVTESGQALTLGGLLASIAGVLAAVAAFRSPDAS